jgi:hypothetical protein
MKMCEDFVPNFGDKRIGCCIMTTQSDTFFFNREVFTIHSMTVVLLPTLLFCFARFKMKLKGCHFDTSEVSEAELHVVLNIFREHGFQDAFKKMTSVGNGAYMRKGTTSRVMMASRPKPDGSTSPGNYGYQ